MRINATLMRLDSHIKNLMPLRSQKVLNVNFTLHFSTRMGANYVKQ